MYEYEWKPIHLSGLFLGWRSWKGFWRLVRTCLSPHSKSRVHSFFVELTQPFTCCWAQGSTQGIGMGHDCLSNAHQESRLISLWSGIFPETDLEMNHYWPPLLLYIHLNHHYTFTPRYPYGFSLHSFKFLFNIFFSRKLYLSTQKYFLIILSPFTLLYFSTLYLSLPDIIW